VAEAVPKAAGPRVGIVTVLYGSEDVVDGFFASLALQGDVEFKLYVIDNSPVSVTLERCRALAQQHGVNAEFVFNNANLGVARGNNQGIELALRDGCQSVLLANNDTEFGPGTLATLAAALDAGEVAVTPKMLYYGPERLIWYAGGRIDAWTLRTPHIGMLAPDRGQFDTAGPTGYAPTCFLLVKASVFEHVGVMDETYFVYYDDTDFVWRLNETGARIFYLPQAVVQHKVSTSTGGGRSPFTLYYTNRNRIYFIRKNFQGVHRAITLGYVLFTRLLTVPRLSRAQAQRLWAGVRDGLQMAAGHDAR
jgi:GT2 family glycosyltransferase